MEADWTVHLRGEQMWASRRHKRDHSSTLSQLDDFFFSPTRLSEQLANRNSFFPHILERYSSRFFQWADAVMHFGQTNSPGSLARIICSSRLFFLPPFFFLDVRWWRFCAVCTMTRCLLGLKFQTTAVLMLLCTDATNPEESEFSNCGKTCQVSSPSFDISPSGSFTSRWCVCQSVRHTGGLI